MNSATKSAARTAKEGLMVPEVMITGPWEITVNGVKLNVTEPRVVRVIDEAYDNLPVYRKTGGWQGGGWNDGLALRGVAGIGCAQKMALDPYSVRLRLPDGTEMRRGIDFDYTEAWGTVGRLTGGRISETQNVLISYRYIPNRLDSVIMGADGKLRIENGVPRSYCPKLPALKDGETRLLNIFTDAQTDKLTEENIFIITETEFPAESARGQQTFIPNVMKKLKNGEHVKILAWGDSVTECDYLPPEDRWQAQFLNRLKRAFPNADIELVSNGWGSHTIPSFLNEPEGSIHNYQKTVLGVKADLVPVLFVPVERAFYGSVVFAQVKRTVRVTLEHYDIGLIECDTGKYLSLETEYHHRFIKRHILRNQRQTQTVFPKQFYIHNRGKYSH